MQRHNTDILQSLKWLQNEAPNIQRLISDKSAWYGTYHNQFWDDWYRTAFNIDTASDFGIIVWCIILGISAEPFSLEPIENNWAFGEDRENFVYSGPLNPDDHPELNAIGGNFFGGGAGAIGNLEEIRNLIKLRYVSLVHNGSIYFINQMLAEIFNDGKAWDFDSGRFFYAMDVTGVDGTQPLIVSSISIESDGESMRLRDFPRQQYMNRDAISITGAQSSSMVDDEWTIIASAVNPVMAVQTTCDVGVHTIQFSLESLGANQVIVTINNTSSSVTRAVIDAATGAVISTSGSLLEVGRQVSDSGDACFFMTVNVAAPNPSVTISFAKSGRASVPVGEGKGLVVKRPMLTQGAGPGVFFPAYDTPGELLDYSVDDGGLLSVDPVIGSLVGSKIYWKGSWRGGATLIDKLVGTTDGAQTSFQIPQPANSVESVDKPFVIEYRIGPSTPITDQAVALMNNPETGIMPTCAGCRYTVTKEIV